MDLHADKPKVVTNRSVKQSHGRKRYTLANLVARMSKASLHAEITTGKPRGREAW